MDSQTSGIRSLIAQARAGDAASRDQLFQRCRNYVAVLARAQMESWMGGKVDASDLVQQTLLEAHRGFDNFTGQAEGEWLAWLKQILAHNAQDEIRRFRAAKRAAGRELALPGAGESGLGLSQFSDGLATPSQALMAHERELALADAMLQLSEDHQTVLHLRSLQRLAFDEVARRMGRTRPAAQMLWMRAVQRLESLLSEAEGA
jgi:RNA polymerase sigma-70 factor (ECF subfamily)